MKKLFPLILLLLSFGLKAQITLEATGVTDTYKLINDALAPGANVLEVPDCAHPDFGPHITQVFDETLQKYVFAFHIHVRPDNDRCKVFDRQRIEIKTFGSSPSYLKGYRGETVCYDWYFKLPKGFQATSKFTHIHQIKAVGGDDGMPIFTLTVRGAKSKQPAQVELNHAIERKLYSVDLSLFEGEWVKVSEKVGVDENDGTYSIEIRKIKSNELIFQYENEKIQTILPSNDFIRPKWGIYRSILEADKMRDETVYFDKFILSKHLTKDENQGPVVAVPRFSVKRVDDNLQIQYNLSENSDLRLDILDSKGLVVKTLARNKSKEKGFYTQDADLSDLEKGTYTLRIITKNYTDTEPLIIE